MNETYALWRLYQNHFSPDRPPWRGRQDQGQLKMGEEIRAPKTPYQSADGELDSPRIAAEAKEKLTAVLEMLSPFHLKKDIEKKLRQLFHDLWTHEP